jgi:hypothetical protein
VTSATSRRSPCPTRSSPCPRRRCSRSPTAASRVPRPAEPDAIGDGETLAELTRAGEDLEAIAVDLEEAGLRAFEAAYAEVIDDISGYVAADGRGAAA